MILAYEIKLCIEEKFGILFDVIPIENNFVEEYIITPSKSHKNYFSLQLSIKDDSRLTIFLEPSKYGKYLVDKINKSGKKQRNIFIQYWDELSKKFKVTVKINEISVSKDDFLEKKEEWEKFSIRITTPYFYENANKNKNSLICKNTSIVLSMLFSLLEYEYEGYQEGQLKKVYQNKYERNPLNRDLCLYVKGYKCGVCGFDFETKYGDIGKNFIEVHHIVPVSKLGANYILDPINDLIPLCSNCHSMIHKKEPPYSPDELKKIISEVDLDES